MSGKLFIIKRARRHNFGEHWRVWACPVVDPVPAEMNTAIIAKKSGLVVPISDYEVSSEGVEFCVDYDLPGDEQEYAGVYVLSMQTDLIAFL